MEGVEALFLKYEHIKWNFYKKYTHVLKLDDLNASLLRFCQIDLQMLNTRGILDPLVAKDAQMRMIKGDVGRWSSDNPLLKGVVIVFDYRVRDLKMMVLKDSTGDDECSIVVVSAARGSGKTTLMTTVMPMVQDQFSGTRCQKRTSTGQRINCPVIVMKKHLLTMIGPLYQRLNNHKESLGNHLEAMEIVLECHEHHIWKLP